MSTLPQIGTGNLTTGSRGRKSPEKSKRSKKRKARTSPIEGSENLPPVFIETDNDLHSDQSPRSRSYDPEIATVKSSKKHKRKQDLDNRSKSLEPSGNRHGRKYRPLEDFDINGSCTDLNSGNNNTSIPNSDSDKRVHFSDNSNEVFNEKKKKHKSIHHHIAYSTTVACRNKYNSNNPEHIVPTSTPSFQNGSQNGYQNNATVNNTKANRSFSFKSSKQNPTTGFVNSRQINNTFANSLRADEPPPTNTTGKSKYLWQSPRTAKIWTETYSDPGPGPRSIDQNSIIKGRATDQRRGRVPNDAARAKHAQYLKQIRQDGRPKAADKGRRLQSLPSKKEQHDIVETKPPEVTPEVTPVVPMVPPTPVVPMVPPTPVVPMVPPTPVEVAEPAGPIEEPPFVEDTEDRHVTSAPSKEQKHKVDVPMPKFNSLLSKDSTSTESPARETTMKQRTTVSPSKTERVKPKEKSTQGSGPAAVGPTVQDEENKKSTKTTGPKETFFSTKEEKANDKNDPVPNLPHDDHGPVNKTRESPPAKEPTADKQLKYYATPRDKEAKEVNEVPPLKLQSEKSYKTDRTMIQNSPRKGDTSRQTNGHRRPTSPSTQYTDNSKKKREVTIIVPKKPGSDDEDDNGLHEYVYSDTYDRRPKPFDEMDDDEKVEYFRDELHMRPEQIRELTFHPKTNVPQVIHKTYTSTEALNWTSGKFHRAKSGKRPKSKRTLVYKKIQTIVPHQRKSFMLSRLQGVVYRHINKVYGASPKTIREKQFFNKLAQVQFDEYQRRYEKLAEREQRRIESKFRQRDQLKNLRKKFEDDAWRRFMTQYVTSKVVEAEYNNREEYGLPNDLGSHPNMRRRQKTISPLSPKRRSKVNRKKYENIFNYKGGPEVKTDDKPLKFEGFDTVYIDSEDEDVTFDAELAGQLTRKRQDVDALMREAKQLLDQTDFEDTDYEDDSPRTPRVRRPVRSYEHVRGDRPIYRRPQERKRVTGTESEVTQSSKRSKSRSRASPKTMKELVDSRRPARAQDNRYKASAFKSMKKDLLQDSVKLNQKLRNSKSPTKLPNLQKSSESPQRKPIEDTGESPKTPMTSPIPPIRTPSPQKTVTVSTVTTTTEEVVTENNTSQAKKTQKDKSGNVYLENTETQMGIEMAREATDNELNIRKESPAKSSSSDQNSHHSRRPSVVTTSKTTTETREVVTVNGIKTETQKNKHSKDNTERVTSRASIYTQNYKPERVASRASLYVQNNKASDNKQERVASRASVYAQNNKPSDNKPERVASRASIYAQHNKPSDYNQERVNSRASIYEKTERNIQRDKAPSRAPSRLSVTTNSKQNIENSKVITTQRRESKTSVQITEDLTNNKNNTLPAHVRASRLSVSNENKINAARDTKSNNSPNGNENNEKTVKFRSTANIRETSPSKTPMVNGHTTSTNNHKVNNRNVSPTKPILNGHSESPDSQDAISHKTNSKAQDRKQSQSSSHLANGNMPPNKAIDTQSQQNGTSNKVTVQKSVNVSENVNETTYLNGNKTDERVHLDKYGLAFTKNGMQNSRRVNQSKERTITKGKQSPRSEKSKSRPSQRSRSRSRTPVRSSVRDQRKTKGGRGTSIGTSNDTRLDRDEYERRGQAGNRGRQRSDSRGRKQSLHRERKRSVSNERRHRKGGKDGRASRFPEIEHRDARTRNYSPDRSHTKVTRSQKVEEQEYTTERLKSPAETAPGQWKSLVEKYLRQPSPKVGKSEDRRVLETTKSVSTDDDDEEMDIFERAKRRYLLDTDDEDSDA